MSFTISPTESSMVDAETLVARVAELARAQRCEDVEGFVELFDKDAVWVSAGGVRLIGRDAIAAFTREVLPGAFAGDLSVRYEVDHIRFFSPDVALTAVNQEYVTADGAPFSPRQEGRPSYVWRRSDGVWRIAGGQNTRVPVEASGGDADASPASDETHSSPSGG